MAITGYPFSCLSIATCWAPHPFEAKGTDFWQGRYVSTVAPFIGSKLPDRFVCILYSNPQSCRGNVFLKNNSGWLPYNLMPRRINGWQMYSCQENMYLQNLYKNILFMLQLFISTGTQKNICQAPTLGQNFCLSIDISIVLGFVFFKY